MATYPLKGVRGTLLAVFTLLACLLVPGTSRAEFLFLADGSIIEGTVLSQTKESVSMRTKAGEVLTYPATGVMRVLYTELYMGKQYVRLTDGTSIEGYMVFEDRVSFTFRKALNKPEEFVIPREKVLFMARKNPNELRGVADRTSVTLEWKPPYSSVKSYNIYLRLAAEAYAKKSAASTTKTQHVLTGLHSSTDYALVVTAVDEEGIESLPSNEIRISTGNYEPEAPREPRCGMIDLWREKKLKTTVSWDPARDPDGIIQSYEIHLRPEEGVQFVLAATAQVAGNPGKGVRVTQELTGLEDRKNYVLKVRAVDDRSAFSPFSEELRFSTENTPPFPVVDVLGTKEKYQGGNGISVRISWAATLDKDGIVKGYRVYEIAGKETRLIAEALKNEYVIQGLALDKLYEFEVRAVDNRGDESVSNKMFQVSTTNDPPPSPSSVTVDKQLSGDGKKMSITASWPAAEDEDGQVVKYRVYSRVEGKEVYLGETTTRTYTVHDVDANRDFDFVVRAVDNRGMESSRENDRKRKITKQKSTKQKSELRRTGSAGTSKGIVLAARGMFLYPLRDFTKMYGMGGGGMLSVRFDRLTGSGFTLGVDLGYAYFSGNAVLFENTMLIPLFLSAGYQVRIRDFFMITPSVGIGGMVLLDHRDPARARNLGVPISRTGYQPAFTGGLRFDFLLAGKIVLGLGAEYTGIIEKKGLMDYISAYIEAGYRF